MTKAQLLAELSLHTWVQLRPSSIHGIGVFAIRDIPKGCREMFGPPHDEWTTLTHDEVNALPEHARQMIENYCLYDAELYYVPSGGFKTADLSMFLNHSDIPNIRSVDDGDYFEALQDIPAGTELLIDYGEIVEDATEE